MKNFDLLEYVYSKLRTERIFRCFIITYLLLWCITSFLMLLDYDSKRLAISIFALLPVMIGVPIYFGHYFPLFRSTQWLRKKGIDFTQEIRLKKAVISLKPCVVVPFSQIAWIFLDPFYGEDSEPIYHVLNIYCKDGSVFKIENNSTGWYELLISELPEIMSGISPEKRKLYLQTNPTACDKRNRVKTIWGIVLLIVMLSLGSLSLFVTKSIEPMGVVLLVALLIGGIVLIRQGKNKNK